MNLPDAINYEAKPLLSRAVRVHMAITAGLLAVCATWPAAHGLLFGIAIGAAIGGVNLAAIWWAANRLVSANRPVQSVAQVLLALKLVLTCLMVALALLILQPSPIGLTLGWTSSLVALIAASLRRRSPSAPPWSGLVAH
ncbi:MAG: hypothetical protein EXR77_11425 [Myxococcales bacterium]|nr:hypothetical protein [Myxococcales bacterium]